MDRPELAGEADRLYDVLLGYLESLEQGVRPDTAEFIARHPEFAPELQEYLETQDRLDGLTAPVREVSRAVRQAAHSGSLSVLGVGTAADGIVSAGARSVGRYEILGEIGRGGMGVVYKALDRQLGRLVAVKMIRSAGHASAADFLRFLSEVRAKARLHHPNIVPVYEIGEADGLPYFVMALVEGGSLHGRLSDGPLPAVEAARLMQQVADAIQHAHDRGVLHRDLKPHNILLQYEGEKAFPATLFGSAGAPRFAGATSAAQPVPMVSDFGLARLTEQDGVTATGQILGTPGYMSPEQATGRVKDVGFRSDVYGLGAVLYCLLTGRPPFQAATAMQTLHLVQEQDPLSPRRLNPAVPSDLEAVCLKCLEKMPGRRYASAADVAKDLQRFIDGTATLARPDGSLRRLWRWAQRRPTRAGMVAACTTALLTLAVGTIAYTLQLRAHNSELGRAREQERSLKEEAEARGHLLQRRAYGEGIRRAAECWENLRQQMNDQESGRPVPDILSELPPAEECLLSAPPGDTREDLRSYEWYFLHRLGSGLRVLRGHRGDPIDVALSRDGGLALSAGGNDGTARLWNLKSGKETWCLRRGGEVNAVALSPDGRFMARAGCGGDDGSGGERADLLVWDRQTGEQAANLACGARRVNAVAFSPDGKTVAAIAESLDRAGLVVVWEVGTWRQRFQWRTSGTGSTLCFSPDSRSLADVQLDSKKPAAIRIHDLQTGQERLILLGRFTDGIFRLAWAPDGRTLASGGGQGQVVLWDIATATPLKDWSVPEMLISGLGFSPDGEALAVAAKTRAGSRRARAKVQLWSVSTGQPCSDAWGPGGLIHNLAFSTDWSVALACGDTMVRLWDPERLKESQALPWNHKETWTTAFSPDGRTLVTGGDDNKVRLWDVDRGQLRATLTGHAALVSGLAFHPDGRFVVSVSYDGKIRFWDVASGSSLGPALMGSTAAIRCLAFAPDGRTLATGGRDHNIRLWDVLLDEGGHPKVSLRVELTGHGKDLLCLAFSPDGQLLASACDDRTIRLWDGQSGTPVRTIEESVPVRCVVFAPDGRLAWGTDEGDVKLAATAEGSAVMVLAGHAGLVRTLTFTRDGRTLASAGDDRTVRLWQAATGQALLTLRGHDKSVYAASFAPNGRRLATGCYDGTVRLWLTELDGL